MTSQDHEQAVPDKLPSNICSFGDLRLPSVSIVRQRIEAVKDLQMSIFLKASYLLATRASELCGIAKKCEHAYGPRGTDLAIETYYAKSGPVDVAVFPLKTAKRQSRKHKGKEIKENHVRRTGLPLDPRFEPWTTDLVKYWQDRGDQLVFPISRNAAEYFVETRGTFSGLAYPIEAYGSVEKHGRECCLHALRHVRSSELFEKGFQLEEVAVYGGWAVSRMNEDGHKVSSVLEKRYLEASWRKYIEKLLKPYPHMAPVSPQPLQPSAAVTPTIVPEPTPEAPCQSTNELVEASARIEELQKENASLVRLLRRVNEIDPDIISQIRQGKGGRHRIPAAKARIVASEEEARLTYNAF